jgi:AbrB family looped-hinge helix DNA binding protein
MDKVTISPKYQVVIPQRIRQAMQLIPGQVVQVIMSGNRIKLLTKKTQVSKPGFSISPLFIS